MGNDDFGHKSIQEAAFVFGTLLIRLALELHQHKFKLCRGDLGHRPGSCINLVLQALDLGAELIQAGGEHCGTSAIFNGVDNIGLLSSGFLLGSPKFFYFRTFGFGQILLLHLHAPTDNLLYPFWLSNKGSGHLCNGIFQLVFAHRFHITALFAVAFAGIILVKIAMSAFTR